MTTLLSQATLVSGPRRIESKIRPRRAVFLVDPRNPQVALAAIGAACLEWGGQHQLLVPCAPGNEPEPVWTAIIAKHDPDIIVDLVGVDPAFVEKIVTEVGCIVRSWDPNADEIEVVGASLFSVLRPKLGNPPPGERHVTLALGSLAEHPLGLPLAFRFGTLDRRPVRLVNFFTALSSLRIERPATSTDLRRAEFEDILEVVHFEADRLSDEQLVRLTLVPPLDFSEFSSRAWGSMPKYWTLPALTTVGLQSQEPYSVPLWASRNMFGMGLLSGDKCPEPNLSRVVVVGDPSSVPDLCLAWDLRAQRSRNRWLPVWVTPEWLSDPSVLEALIAAARQEPPSLIEEWTCQQSTLHLVSATLSPADLKSLIAKFSSPLDNNGIQFCIHDRSQADGLFTSDFSVGECAASVGVFSEGRATCISAGYRDLGDFIYPEQIVSVMSIENYWPPRGFSQWNSDSESVIRFASDGMATFLTAERNPSGQMVRLSTLSGWDMVTSIARSSGFNVKPSDKGMLGIGIMRLLGEDGLAVLASSLIHRLLSEMAEIHGRQATQATSRRIDALGAQKLFDSLVTQELSSGQFDRHNMKFDTIRNKLQVKKKTTCEAVVRWLVERKVLLRGVEMTCSQCGLRRWYPMNRLSDSHTCDGCQHQSAIPLEVDKTHWLYRLNELIARAVDQGVLTHLIAAPTLWGDDPTVVGFHPGLKLEPIGGSALRPCEVDLFTIRNGRPVIAECKRSAREFKQDDLNKLVTVGQQLNCSHIIFATTDFGEVPEYLQRMANTSTQPRIEVWDGQFLLDPYASPPPTAEVRPVDYLEKIAAVLEQRVIAQ